ncbi:hypothetical protein A2160_01700 [Candidatus Beckwithbacteria bacterium RBG_13_42_9]|uniref:leucine--tRNA ligase n=1 Tax=Candidatus Beckwithbacteria bacterium RBG_13_42_9 TaxID=1797457 RepID=A0A1F5E3V7_9BACT|nr:MAG: hypothetical protein A2160_01700 [Candidatus Beckwithbacteria bacterium RBG_13_42_9]
MQRFVKKVYRLSLAAIQNPIGKEDEMIWKNLEQLTQKMADDLAKFKYNTAIAKLMEFVNLWSDNQAKVGSSTRGESGPKAHQPLAEAFGRKVVARIALLLAPLAPHMAEEIYQETRSKLQEASCKRQENENLKLETCSLKQFSSVHQQLWPKVQSEALEEETVKIVIQVNGKKRGEIKVQSAHLRQACLPARQGFGGQAKLKAQGEVEKLAKENEKVQTYLQGQQIKKTVFVPGRLINFVV